MKIITAIIASVLLFFSANIYATQLISWKTWVQQLRVEALAQGIRPELFDSVFDGMVPDKRVLHFDKTQPEKRITFDEYRKSRIDAFRIKLGISAYKHNRQILDEIGERYGVSPCFILAFWGIESSYGHYKGNFPVLKSLASLAYNSPRSEFFRGELLIALQIVNEGHVSLADFKGEWAGASGNPQFLPTSWKKYAVDYEGNGHKDIWNSLPDSFASIANYLKINGWQTGQPWAIEVDLPKNFSDDLTTMKVEKTVTQWVKMGVRPAYGFQLPANRNLTAMIVQPFGGPAFMAFKNFTVIMKYNNSTFYAGSVGYLADSICQGAHKKDPVFGIR